MSALPKPLREDADTVTLARADFEALAELLADAHDLAEAEAVSARIAAGETEVFPFEVAERILDGEHPVAVFREHRGLSARALAQTAGVSPAYLSEIEGGKKPGSFDAMRKLAGALGVSMDLLAWDNPG